MTDTEKIAQLEQNDRVKFEVHYHVSGPWDVDDDPPRTYDGEVMPKDGESPGAAAMRVVKEKTKEKWGMEVRKWKPDGVCQSRDGWWLMSCFLGEIFDNDLIPRGLNPIGSVRICVKY